jgi:hypothetical protein
MGYKRVERSCERCSASFLAHKPSQSYCSRTCARSARNDAPATCAIEGCDAVAVARGWCDRHYSAWKRTGEPTGWRDDPVRRFNERVERTDDCWLWTGRLSGGGYGQFKVDGRQVMVHRFSYEHFVGPILEGLQLDHLCRVRNCVNPDHLEPVDRPTNVARAVPYWERLKPMPRCVDCGKELARRDAVRCRPHAAIHRSRH